MHHQIPPLTCILYSHLYLIYSLVLVVLLDISYSTRALILLSVSTIPRIFHSKYLLFQIYKSLFLPLLVVLPSSFSLHY